MSNIYGGIDESELYASLDDDEIAKIKQSQEYKSKMSSVSQPSKITEEEAPPPPVPGRWNRLKEPQSAGIQPYSPGSTHRWSTAIIVLVVAVIGLASAVITLCVAFSVTTTELQDDVAALRSRVNDLEGSEEPTVVLAIQDEAVFLEAFQELNASFEIDSELLRQEIAVCCFSG